METYLHKKNIKTFLTLISIVFSGTKAYTQNICQSITPLIINSSVNETVIVDPETNEEIIYYDLCQGETLALNASAEFPENNTRYPQTIENTRFYWSINDAEKSISPSFSHEFNNSGGYVISLYAIDSRDCPSDIHLEVFVRVSMPAKINPIISPAVVCPDISYTIGYDDESDISLSTKIEVESWESPPCEDEFAKPLYLPDGNGILYSTNIQIACFDDEQLLLNVDDILSVDLNIEHSYAGDLDILLTAPNGVQVILFEKTGSSIWLGEATDDDDTPTNPGVGYNYGWSMNPTYNGLMSDGFENNTVTFLDSDAEALKPDTYLPVGDFKDLIGTPLNGIWTLSIKDNLKRDNGWIFSWGININKELAPPSWSFQNLIVDEYFTPNSNLTESPNQSTFMMPQEGIQNFGYEVVDNFGCIYREDLNITTKSIEVQTESTDEYCSDNNGALNIQINGGTPDYNILWESGSTSANLSYLSEGIYQYTITDALGCSKTGAARVLNNEMGLRFNTETKKDHCQQGLGEISITPTNGTKPYFYEWNHSNENQNQLKNLSKGTYSVQITDDEGCMGHLEIDVIDSEDPKANFLPDNDTVAYQKGEVIFLNQSTVDDEASIISAKWYVDGRLFSEDFQTQFNFIEMGLYTVSLSITDDYECSNSHSKEIVVTENYFFWAPTAFSPNADHINDTFKPIVDRVNESSFQLYIYDIWGKLLFQSNRIDQGWNGKRLNSNEVSQTGTYYYKIQFQSLLNDWHEKTGSFVLLK
jgi:gliding motility-associated-like protein